MSDGSSPPAVRMAMLEGSYASSPAGRQRHDVGLKG